MTSPTRPQIDGASWDPLRTSASAWLDIAHTWEAAFTEIRDAAVRPGGAPWTGAGAAAFQHRTVVDVVTVRNPVDMLVNAAGIATRGADSQDGNKQSVINAVNRAERQDFRVGEDLSVTDTYTYYTSAAEQEQRLSEAQQHESFIKSRVTTLVNNEQEIARQLAAATAGLHEFGFRGDGEDGTGSGDRRDPDGRQGRRLRSDEVFRRPEGGDRGGDHSSTDWAGRAILERYLTGGDDWTITDDPQWTKYMKDNQLLRDQLLDPTQIAAQDALTRFQSGGGPTGKFDQTLHASIENGEGIVGYQYLHGTDRDAGDFHFAGDTTVTPQADGTYKVTLDSGYTWNDKIDPNPIYQTDRTKSRIAEIITLGQADPYDIHITWHAQSTIILDSAGNVLKVEGYPAP